jgi:hypothetical protein
MAMVSVATVDEGRTWERATSSRLSRCGTRRPRQGNNAKLLDGPGTEKNTRPVEIQLPPRRRWVRRSSEAVSWKPTSTSPLLRGCAVMQLTSCTCHRPVARAIGPPTLCKVVVMPGIANVRFDTMTIFTGTVSYCEGAGELKLVCRRCFAAAMAASLLNPSNAQGSHPLPSLRFPIHPHLPFQEGPRLLRQAVSR